MKTMPPKVSICLPIYNCAPTLEETLDSLVTQDYDSFEIVIMDNASDDRDWTRKIVDRYQKQFPNRIRYIRKSVNTHSSYNWNDAMLHAKGQYIAVYHGDDIYHRSIIRREAQVLDDDKKTVAVFSQSVIVNDQMKKIGEIKYPQEEIDNQYVFESFVANDKLFKSIALKGYNFLSCPTFMVRRSALGSKRWFDPQYEFAFDIEYYLRLMDTGKIKVLNGAYHKYRRSAKAGTVDQITKQTGQNEIFEVLDNYMTRHPNLLNNEEMELYNANKQTDWWLAAINCQARGMKKESEDLWKKHYYLTKDYLFLSHHSLRSKMAMAICYDLSRMIGLQDQCAKAIVQYRIEKQVSG